MMMDYITLAGFILAVFVAGVAVGRYIEKTEKFIDEHKDEEHGNRHKNDRR